MPISSLWRIVISARTGAEQQPSHCHHSQVSKRALRSQLSARDPCTGQSPMLPLKARVLHPGCGLASRAGYPFKAVVRSLKLSAGVKRPGRCAGTRAVAGSNIGTSKQGGNRYGQQGNGASAAGRPGYVDEIVSLSADGLTCLQIHQKTGLRCSRVRGILIGSNSGNDAEDIARRYQSGQSLRELSREFRKSKDTIAGILDSAGVKTRKSGWRPSGVRGRAARILALLGEYPAGLAASQMVDMSGEERHYRRDALLNVYLRRLRTLEGHGKVRRAGTTYSGRKRSGASILWVIAGPLSQDAAKGPVDLLDRLASAGIGLCA